MPRKVEHDFKATKYDWDSWDLDKSPKEFIQGEDFDCTKDSFRVSVYVAARSRGMKANTKITDDGVIVQFVKQPKKAAKRPAKKSPAKKRK